MNDCAFTLFKGDFLTLDTNHPRVQEVLVENNTGMILALDGQIDPQQRQLATVMHLPGTCMRGLFGGHDHMLFALAEDALDLSALAGKVASQYGKSVRRLLKAQLRSHGGPIVMTNWSSRFFSAKAMRRVLIDVAHGIEVICLDQSWHSAVLSDALFGRMLPIVRTQQLNGNFGNGVATEDYVLMTLGALPIAQTELEERMLRRQTELFARGNVRINDRLVLGWPQFRAMKALSCSGRLQMPIDATVARWLVTGDKPIAGAQYGSHLKVTGIKFLADGAFGAQNACMSREHGMLYTDGSGGELTLPTLDEFLQTLERWVELGGSAVATHCIGPGAVTKVVEYYQAAFQQFGHALDLHMEHAEVVPVDVLETMVKMQQDGVPLHVCTQPGFNSDLVDYTDRLPPHVMERLNPYASFQASGLKWCGGTDGPITGDDYFGGIAMAVQRQGDQQVSAEYMLKNCVDGPLAVGQPFRVISLDCDPLAQPERLAQLQVLQTWIGVDKVYERVTQA